VSDLVKYHTATLTKTEQLSKDLSAITTCLEKTRSKRAFFCLFSVSRRGASEICDLLGSYAAKIGNSLSTFRTTYRSHFHGSCSTRIVVIERKL